MNVQTIEMDTTTAQEMADLYRSELRKANKENPRRATAVDRLLLRGYKRLAAGDRLIDIVEVFRASTAYDEQCRPRLAFARATASWTQWRRSWDDGDGQFLDLPRAKGKRALHVFPAGTFKTYRQLGHATSPRSYIGRAKARVPPVPLYLRPADSLTNYFILFEAEWEPVPPKDPMLLKQLHDNLFVVVAEWNLTELERAVLQGMMRKEQTT